MNAQRALIGKKTAFMVSSTTPGFEIKLVAEVFCMDHLFCIFSKTFRKGRKDEVTHSQLYVFSLRAMRVKLFDEQYMQKKGFKVSPGKELVSLQVETTAKGFKVLAKAWTDKIYALEHDII